MRKLFKSRVNYRLCGVCGGMGEYFGIDPTLVRLIWIISFFCGVGFLPYIICALIIPRDPGYSAHGADMYRSENAQYR
jgi:phage shock protein PspC (stress-responsive transcriptional regulator)